MSEKLPEQNEDIIDDDYKPFDAQKELQQIKKLDKSTRREKLEEFKENLIMQKLGMAEMIGNLRKQVEQNPDVDLNDLFIEIAKGTRKNNLNFEQLTAFNKAAFEYSKKHEAVEKYRAMYPDDADFFQACFGKKPKGKIDIIKGPMTLFFRCYDPNDYAFVYTFYKHQGNGDATKDDFEKAQSSAGIALFQVKIPELAGVVNAENVSVNSPNFKRVENVQHADLLIDEESSFVINALTSNLYVEFPGAGNFEIRVARRSKWSGAPERIQLFDLNFSNEVPIHDLEIVSGEELKKAGRMNWRGNIFRKVGKQGNEFSDYKDNVTKNIGVGRVDRGFISIAPKSVVINSRNGSAIVRYVQPGIEIMANEESSKKTREHEDQHQFNKLFESVFTLFPVDKLKKATDKHAVIKEFIRRNREGMGIDARAKDEILAYYKEGRTPGDIFRILSENKLYDYKSQDYYKNLIEKLPQKLRDLDGILETKITEEQIAEYVKDCFGADYIVSLKKWTDAINALEKKKYSREDILNLLYQEEQVSSWPNLARRVP